MSVAIIVKKFFAAVFVTWFFAVSVARADDYPIFWRGNKDYPLVFGHTGTAFYLNKKSIKIELNAPPYYIITAATVNVSNSGVTPDHPKYNKYEDPSNVMNCKFFYDEAEMDMREGDISKSSWRYLRPQGINAESGFFLWLGEAVFYVATGRKFYGNYLWKDMDYAGKVYKNEQGEARYRDVFGDNFYKTLAGETP